jgi:excisionase family DNA binding protein
MAGNESDGLMTVDELAVYLKLKPGTIYNRVSRNEIPYLKVGGLLRFRRSEIDDWTEKHRQGAPVNETPADEAEPAA